MDERDRRMHLLPDGTRRPPRPHRQSPRLRLRVSLLRNPQGASQERQDSRRASQLLRQAAGRGEVSTSFREDEGVGLRLFLSHLQQHHVPLH